MSRNLNADSGMKRNPRDEASLKKLEDLLIEKNMFEELNKILECKYIGANKLLIIDLESRAGYSATLVGGANDLVISDVRKLFLRKEDEDWSELPKITRECEDIRIVKAGDLILIECVKPAYSLTDLLKMVSDSKNIVVECYYEWE